MQSPDKALKRVTTWLERQAGWCEKLGSPLYARLLTGLAADVMGRGVSWPLLSRMSEDPPDSAPALRVMGAVHRLVLEGKANALGEHYPSAGGTRTGDPWPAFIATLERHSDELSESIRRPVQTNEVGRAGALICGFLVAARDVRLPLRLLEAGASAGLNLRWDHFQYEARGAKWGPEDSPVRLCDFNSETAPPFDVVPEIVERAGCDINPLDVTTQEGRLTLLSYVWPDQVHRIRLLKGAMEIAARVPVALQRSSAPRWVEDRLRDLPGGVATVVYHSIFFQYMSDDERAAFVAAIEDAGRRASSGSPVAWLRFEHGGAEAETRLKLWPGGEDRLIATSGFHGGAVRYLG